MTSRTDVLSQNVVVFSKNYLPMNRVNIKRAIALLVTGRAEPLDADDRNSGWVVRSSSVALRVPECIRLTVAGHERLWKVPPANRREILRRDNHTCQYCSSTKQLTIDHVIPRAQGGTHTWDNVVVACSRCNALKGNRTPEEARMPLRTKPKAPLHPVVSFAEQFWRNHPM